MLYILTSNASSLTLVVDELQHNVERSPQEEIFANEEVKSIKKLADKLGRRKTCRKREVSDRSVINVTISAD